MSKFVNTNLYSLKNKDESLAIYKILCSSFSLHLKYVALEYLRPTICLNHTLAVLSNDNFNLNAGSIIEGTGIVQVDYHTSMRQSVPTSWFSDTDFMPVLYHVRVIEEDEALPQEFDNYMYCRGERGRHTTDGFRKLRIVHTPRYSRQDKAWQWRETINRSTEDGYISSARFMAIVALPSQSIPFKNNIQGKF